MRYVAICLTALVALGVNTTASAGADDPLERLKSPDEQDCRQAAVTLLAQRQERIRVAVAELRDELARPDRERNVPRVEVLMGFLGDVRAVEAAPLLAEHVSFKGRLGRRDLPGRVLVDQEHPAVAALRKIGSPGKDAMLAALERFPPGDDGIRLLAYVLGKIFGPASARKFLQEKSGSIASYSEALQWFEKMWPAPTPKSSEPARRKPQDRAPREHPPASEWTTAAGTGLAGLLLGFVLAALLFHRFHRRRA